MAAPEKFAPEFGQHLRHGTRRLVTLLKKRAQPAETFLQQTERKDEVAQIAAIERAVRIAVELRQLAVRSVADEVGRSIVHQAHHPVSAPDDGLAVAPRDGRRQETRYLAVGPVRISMRHRNRVVLDEFGAVVTVAEPFEQRTQFAVHVSVCFRRT